ncbi:MAG: hypothetical protein Aurels2KO_01220 [Aureliella sp.]
MHQRLTPVFLLIIACLAASCSFAFADENAAKVKPAGAVPAGAVFERLKSLAGEWRIAKPARSTKVTFEVIAGGSVVVEKWQMSPTRSSMTVYSMDGGQLVFTHYCPQGNAPRLAYSGTGKDGEHRFEFLDGLNLQNPDRSHQHVCWMRFDSDDSFTRSEIYIRNGEKFDAAKHQDSPQVFVRVKK